MAYTKHNFVKGQKFKAEHANYIEEGIVQNEKAIEGKADLDENGKLKEDQLPENIIKDEQITEAVNAALAQAKESGEFKGEKGDKGDTGDKGPQGETGAKGDTGEKGKTAYEYAKDGGYTGTEAEFAEKMAEEMPEKLPNPYALTVNGKTYDGSEAVEIVITGGSDGGATESTLLGQTPITLTTEEKISLMGSGEHSYIIKGKTVADINTAESTAELVSFNVTEDYFENEATDESGEWYDHKITFEMTGLTVGELYTLVVKGLGVDTNNKISSGYFDIRNSDNTRPSELNGVGLQLDAATIGSVNFTASTPIMRIIWHPTNLSYWNNGYRKARIKDLYINKASDGTERTDIIDKSGTFSDIITLGTLPKGVTITSEPVCNVYSLIEESSDDEDVVSLPLKDKTVVCFGDSILGMYRGDGSVTEYIAERTGATVHNVGCSGCRMSVHPYEGYAEFSMWALAKAISEGNWSAQEEGITVTTQFTDQLDILKSLDFNNVDYVVIHYGTNDHNSVLIDNINNKTDYTTLCGALRYSVEKLLSAYPKLRIFISLPTFRFRDGSVSSDVWENPNGHTLPEFIEALVETAKEYKLPIIDCYYGLGINEYNARTFLEDDVHHNLDGRKRLGEYIGSKLISGGDTLLSDGGSEQTGDGGSVQADLSQNDETAPDYVKGRTHYKDFLPLLPEASYTVDEDGLVYGEVNFELIVGDTYKVFYNGTKYTCVCSRYEEDEVTGGFLGNAAAMEGEDTGEPFALIIVEGQMLIAPLDGSTEFTLEIKGFKVVKIPTEYYDRAFYFDVIETETDVYSSTVTPGDIKNAREKDISIIARVRGKDGDERYCQLSYMVNYTYVELGSLRTSKNYTCVVLQTDYDEDGNHLTVPYTEIFVLTGIL